MFYCWMYEQIFIIDRIPRGMMKLSKDTKHILDYGSHFKFDNKFIAYHDV